MADLFRGLITDEGIDKARDIIQTQGWKITPFQFSFTSAPIGEFSTTRTTNSMQSTWYSGYFSTIDKLDNNKLLLTISLSGNESGVARDITEIYITASSSGGTTPFLYSLIQPLSTIVFQPDVGMELSFILTLTNSNKADIYTIEYVDKSKLGNYQLKKEKGQPNGYTPLGANGIVPDNYLPLRDNLPIGTTIPIICSATYIPSGYLPCNGFEYTYAEFTSFYTDYLLTGVVPTCSYQEYQSSVNTYGSCSKFALDTTRGVFRAPLLKNGTYIKQAQTDGEINKIYRQPIAEGASQLDSVALRYFVLVTHGLINASYTNWSAWISQLNTNTQNIANLQATKMNNDFSNATWQPWGSKMNNDFSNATWQPWADKANIYLSNLAPGVTQGVNSWGMPNFGGKWYAAGATWYTADRNYMLHAQTGGIDDRMVMELYVQYGGVTETFLNGGSTTATEIFCYCITAFVPKGGTFMLQPHNTGATLSVIPLIGG